MWLGCSYAFHGTNRRDLQIYVPACLNMKSRKLVERTVPKMFSHGTPSHDLATKTPTLRVAIVAIVIVLVSGSYKLKQLRPKTSFGKSRRRSFLCSATPSSLPFRQFLVFSLGGRTCCHAGLPGHRTCAAPRLASSPHNDATRRATCFLGKIQV